MSRLSEMARFEEPEIVDPIPMFFCDECGSEIYEGETYCEIDKINYCDDCIFKFTKTAER